MISADSYLHLPPSYARWLGGLRWSTGGEAIESPDGRTLVFGRELSLFLDGFATGREPIHFAHVVHLAHLVIRGPLAEIGSGGPIDPSVGFSQLGRPHRNAGALFAHLCRDLPGLPDPPDVEAVCLLLTAGAVLDDRPFRADDPAPSAPAFDDPPMPPFAFERLMLDRLAQMKPEQIHHWLRFGRPPERSAKALADRVEAERPGSYRAALEPLLKGPRLSASARLIDRLDGALALPPRRKTFEMLPTGGYTDLANRGLPERILPSQHALDPDEFLRRFAEHELLYYRREEPHSPDSEELVVLIDQGVRTWGGVRTILAAAAVALARLADRRGIPLRLRSTADPGPSIDPISADPEALTRLLEASDLSPHPADLVASAVSGGEEGRRRDLILLTHPRAIAEEAVERASRGLLEGDRLFAVLVDDRREVQVSQLRRGRPVPLSRFRVDPPEDGPIVPPRRPNGGGTAEIWTGDVEPIGVPILIPGLGALPSIEGREDSSRLALEAGPRRGGAGSERDGPPTSPEGGGVSLPVFSAPPFPEAGPLFAFDESGEWFLAIGRFGVPVAWRIDGTDEFGLPRGFSSGEAVRRVDAVLGVAGGFVVIGRIGEADRPVAVHYDLGSRTARTYVKYLSGVPAWDWFYVRESHALIARGPDESWYVDLKTGGRFSSQDRSSSEVVSRALAAVESLAIPPPQIAILHDDDTRPSDGPFVHLQTDSGTISVEGVAPSWKRFRPVSDGRPVLVGARLERALWRAGTLALYVDRGTSGRSWLLFQGPEPTLVSRKESIGPGELALSIDGKAMAVRDQFNSYALYAVGQTGPLARYPRSPRVVRSSMLQIRVGADWLVVHQPRLVTSVTWDEGRLKSRSVTPGAAISDADLLKTPPDLALSPCLQEEPGTEPALPEVCSYDPDRFEPILGRRGAWVVRDRLGLILFGTDDGGLACVLFVSDTGKVAAWLPDGSRFGPHGRIGGPPTPGAKAWVAEALRDVFRNFAPGPIAKEPRR